MEILSIQEYEDIISWLPNGKSFLINDKKKLNDVLSCHFQGIKYDSFIRKLNRWGFRITKIRSSTSACAHELFVRDNPSLCSEMRCAKKLDNPSCDDAPSQHDDSDEQTSVINAATKINNFKSKDSFDGSDTLGHCPSTIEDRNANECQNSSPFHGKLSCEKDSHDFHRGSQKEILSSYETAIFVPIVVIQPVICSVITLEMKI